MDRSPPPPVPPPHWEAADPSSRPDHERVVVTGHGAVTSLGANIAQTFDAMARAQSGIRELTRFDPSGLPCTIGGQIDDAALAAPEPTDAIGGSGWRLLRTAAAEAGVAEATADHPDRTRLAIILGGHGETPRLHDIRVATRHCDADGNTALADLHGEADYDATQFTRRAPEIPSALLAQRFNVRGPVMPIVSACAAGTQAIGEAMRMLRAGRSDLVIAGGSEPLLTYSYFLGFALLGALTRRYPSPQGASRPFDRRRNGFVIAEGAGVLVLERLSDAKARGREVLGEILGYGDSADGYRITDLHPHGSGAVAAMSGALETAHLHPDAVQYINAHGTSTPTNDPVETLAIKRLFGERAYALPVSSNKSMIGHTIGSAGAIEAICTLRGMREDTLLPTINQEAPDRRCDLDYVPNEARKQAYQIALSNSFGFGGQNGCLCLGRGT